MQSLLDFYRYKSISLIFIVQDTPGFIVNRLLVPYLLEAVRMIERGDATAEGHIEKIKLDFLKYFITFQILIQL